MHSNCIPAHWSIYTSEIIYKKELAKWTWFVSFCLYIVLCSVFFLCPIVTASADLSFFDMVC
jgi:hypothetical protein